MNGKQKLRQEMRQRLAELPEETFRTLCAKIVERLTALSEWRGAETIGMTMSMPGEIDTERIIQKAWMEKKRVAVPKADPKLKKMDFRVIQSFDQLNTGFAGIREPLTDQTDSVASEEIDLLVVPGLIFDSKGYRIGFGGGFYDRYLIAYQNVAISLAFEMQMVDRVPVADFDRPVDLIVTEQRVIRRKVPR
jgi:5-formyltetrahydrofolate cyclo-ligase